MKLYPLLIHKHRVVTQKCAVCHVFIGRCVKISKKLRCRLFKAQIQVQHPFLIPDGLPPMTSLLRVTRVCSVTSASGCCTMMLKATSWEISWPILMWTVVHLTNAFLWWTAHINGLMLYNTVQCFIFQKEMFGYLVFFALKKKLLFIFGQCFGFIDLFEITGTFTGKCFTGLFSCWKLCSKSFIKNWSSELQCNL